MPSTPLPPPRTGTAGWNVPAALQDEFPGEREHLARYARRMNAVEINSSFYRSHRDATYARWAAATPAGFRFAVKLPRSITHDRKLREADEPLAQFLGEVAGLGDKLGPLLVQLPPSLAFDPDVAGAFFERLRQRHAGAVVCEPRHASWFGLDADASLVAHRIGRVAADPALSDAAAQPGGWVGAARDGRGGTVYLRLHGSPRRYWSSYETESLRHWHAQLAAYPKAEAWCIFDNTASGAALANALEFQRLGVPAAAAA